MLTDGKQEIVNHRQIKLICRDLGVSKKGVCFKSGNLNKKHNAKPTDFGVPYFQTNNDKPM